MMQLQNLMLAIALAKIYVARPNLLNHTDLEKVWMEKRIEAAIGHSKKMESRKVLCLHEKVS